MERIHHIDAKHAPIGGNQCPPRNPPMPTSTLIIVVVEDIIIDTTIGIMMVIMVGIKDIHRNQIKDIRGFNHLIPNPKMGIKGDIPKQNNNVCYLILI